jgi:hypothetical protein
MKTLLSGIAVLCLILVEVPSFKALVEEDDTEVTGVIKNVSVNVHLVVIDASDKDKKDSVKTEPSIKSVSVGPNTKITVNGKPATINDLQAGQFAKAKLEPDNSKAVSIDASTALAEK